MPQVLSKFIKDGVDYVKSREWVEPLGKTLTGTGEIFNLLVTSVLVQGKINEPFI